MYQDFFNKNDDYLDEFKQKVARQKIATIEERRSELARSRNNFLGTFAGIALAAVVGWFVLSPQYAEHNKEIPVIRRPQTAVKIKPENPGGMEIPNQDKDVYNIVEKKNVDNTVIENLLPTPEQPKLPDIVPEVTDVDENAANLDEIVEEVVAPAENKAEQSATLPEKPNDVLEAPKPTEVEKKVEAAIKPVVKEEPKEEPKAEVPASAGNWQIQLIASKNKTAVEKTWQTLSAKYADLQQYPHEVQTSDLGAQGIFYRLRAGAFATRDAAAKACATLKTKGLKDCIVKER
ncbi:MAG: SPOR domain-containing protein [Alphaproteobacteria bacterium]|nr:SPOR domain-containing protein [Alphaproteobacteria bacterium]